MVGAGLLCLQKMWGAEDVVLTVDGGSWAAVLTIDDGS